MCGRTRRVRTERFGELAGGGKAIRSVTLQAAFNRCDESFREIALDYMRAYLPVVEEAIAPEVDGRRRQDAAALTLAVIRGLLIDVQSTGELERAWRAFELFATMGADAVLLVRKPD